MMIIVHHGVLLQQIPGEDYLRKESATRDISTSQFHMFKEPIKIVMPELSGVQVSVSDPN